MNSDHTIPTPQNLRNIKGHTISLDNQKHEINAKGETIIDRNSIQHANATDNQNLSTEVLA